MKSVRLALLALTLALLSITHPAVASSYTTDQSDLWWTDPPGSESGWGIQFVHRNSTIFATMFIYGPTGAPTWYTATMVPNPPGGLFWSGDLYATTGPWFGTVPFSPADVTVTKVGAMTWNGQFVTHGTLTYTVNGVLVTKTLTRQTLVNENYSGRYGGGIHEEDTLCIDPSLNGTAEYIGVLNVVQNGASVAMTGSFPNRSCTYTGTLSQHGQMGDVDGTFACSNGSSGSFHIFEFQVTEYSIIGRFTAAATVPAGCQASGWFGGLFVTTF